MTSPITPTVGRVVWFHPRRDDNIARNPTYPHHNDPLAAHIAAVISPSIVNLMVIDAKGMPHGYEGVFLHDGQSDAPVNGDWCEWMPYQKGQAAKTESLEQKLAGA